MQEFRIPLKNEKSRFYAWVNWLILVLHIALFLYIGVFTDNERVSKASLISAIVVSLLILIRLFQDKYRTQIRITFTIIYTLLAFSWAANGWYWMAPAPLIFLGLFTVSTRESIVIVTSDKIIYPSFPRKEIEWKQLNNVVLKDDLLTIDFKSDKIIQQMTVGQITNEQQKEFNDFCRMRITE